MAYINMGAARGHAITYTTRTRAAAAGAAGRGAADEKQRHRKESFYKENMPKATNLPALPSQNEAVDKLFYSSNE